VYVCHEKKEGGGDHGAVIHLNNTPTKLLVQSCILVWNISYTISSPGNLYNSSIQGIALAKKVSDSPGIKLNLLKPLKPVMNKDSIEPSHKEVV
jgi:hypothetical protein